ncbi:hypothetical protein [Candidatus Epulonipiscium viviparus]|uniref:hypothetical protein n=1 Tax=Candidatus Epulonipiscium viviparus TaxID=420336 RepID=UPI00016C046E|nr:hypothetical protein [Candidatus Epulopiscium viviparus]
MTKNIYIKGTNSDWYEDVTFRIKDKHIVKSTQNLSAYADELIGKHMKLRGYTEYKKHDIVFKAQNKLYRRIELFCNLSLLFLCIILTMCVML